MRFIVLFFLLSTAVSRPGYFLWYKARSGGNKVPAAFSLNNRDDNRITLLRLRENANLIKAFAVLNKYNTTRCFLVDMKIASGRKRFFLYNLHKDSVELAGLVAHGSGSDKGGNELYFSNMPNSNCTSLGKYKIGKPYQGRFGLAYKLYGLDQTNSNAFQRFVVLHAYPSIPEEEVAPFPINESLGCPMVAPAFLHALKNYIDTADQPILLWIYY